MARARLAGPATSRAAAAFLTALLCGISQAQPLSLPPNPAPAGAGIAGERMAPALATVGVACRAPDPVLAGGLALLDAVERVLCRSPALLQSVWLVDEQQANVDAARVALRPRWFGSAEWATNRIPSSNSAAGSLSSSLTGSLGLSWVVYDAGGRQSGVEQARRQLDSARASQLNAVLAQLNELLRQYVEAATASARLAALVEAEGTARRSLDAAIAKHEAQVASLAERLQAETALAQASLERVRAEGAWETARGLLAVAMGLAPDTPLALAPVETAFPADAARTPERSWMEEAKARHPRLQAARADVEALRARLAAVQAEGRPNVQLAVGANMTRDISTPGARFEQSLSSSVVASVPLFNQAEQRAREGQVQAQIGAREAALEQVERELDSELWRAGRALETEAGYLRAAGTLLATASRSYDITEGRYRAGVGSILELLTTQAALANARAQLVQARLAHAQARLRLEVAAGTIRLQR